MNDLSIDPSGVDSAAVSAAAAIVQALDAKAERFQTPCGDGHMLWRRWGEGPPAPGRTGYATSSR